MKCPAVVNNNTVETLRNTSDHSDHIIIVQTKRTEYKNRKTRKYEQVQLTQLEHCRRKHVEVLFQTCAHTIPVLLINGKFFMKKILEDSTTRSSQFFVIRISPFGISHELSHSQLVKWNMIIFHGYLHRTNDDVGRRASNNSSLRPRSFLSSDTLRPNYRLSLS